MADSGPGGVNGDVDVDVEIDIRVLVQALVHNPAFIRLVAIASRDELTKGKARQNSNIFGLTAQAPSPTQNPRRIS
jgi:hypothetical protein